MIPLVISVVSTGMTVAAGRAPIFSAFFPEGLGRQLSESRRLVESELMAAAACLCVCPSSSISSTAQSDSTLQIFSPLCHRLLLAVNQRLFSLPSPSLMSRPVRHLLVSPCVWTWTLFPLAGEDSPPGRVARHMASFLLQPAN